MLETSVHTQKTGNKYDRPSDHPHVTAPHGRAMAWAGELARDLPLNVLCFEQKHLWKASVECIDGVCSANTSDNTVLVVHVIVNGKQEDGPNEKECVQKY